MALTRVAVSGVPPRGWLLAMVCVAAIPAFCLARETTAPTLARTVGLGAIRGHVDVQGRGRSVAAPPRVADFGAPRPLGSADRRRSVVYLETAPRGLEQPLPRTATLDQRDETFVPYVVAVTVGSRVEFPNSDPIYHNVFSLSKARRFDLGRYPKGQSRGVRFDKPGIVRVFCEIHSQMNAWILVFAHEYFSTTDTEGRYRIEGVPPGTYTLAVWNDGAVRARRPVTVAPEAEVEADFEVRR